MDPITLVVTALVAGASAGLQDTVAQVVKDAYGGLKSLLVRRNLDVAGLERKPDSESKQSSLREDLQDLEANDGPLDESVLSAAQHLLEMVKLHEPQAAAAVGVDLEHLDVGGSLSIKDIDADGTGVRGKDWSAKGDVTIEGVRARPTSNPLADLPPDRQDPM